MEAALRGIDYHLPESVLSNEQLTVQFPHWGVDKIEAKTGIVERRIAAPAECASDLAEAAARKLFRAGLHPAEVDFLLMCTQSPDYFSPTTACLLQDRLGLPTTAGALDINLGCSGYVYGLSVAHALIASGQARNVLFLTGETYSRFVAADNHSCRPLLGDGATATWLRAETPRNGGGPLLGPAVFGTDGKGADNLIVRRGGFRNRGELGRDAFLFMNGAEVFSFALHTVPTLVAQLLAKAGLELPDVDYFVFHQANRYMLENLCRKIGIPADKFILELRDCGNTGSNSIPIALKRAVADGRIRPGHRVMLVGFGVGYSWAGLLLQWVGD